MNFYSIDCKIYSNIMQWGINIFMEYNNRRPDDLLLGTVVRIAVCLAAEFALIPTRLAPKV